MRWRDRERAGLDDEIRDHIDRETEEHVARGIPREEARRLARLKLGNPALVQEDTRAVWVWRWLERVIQDVASGPPRASCAPGSARPTPAPGRPCGQHISPFCGVRRVDAVPVPANSPLLTEWSEHIVSVTE
jgi:hypothetical protein